MTGFSTATAASTATFAIAEIVTEGNPLGLPVLPTVRFSALDRLRRWLEPLTDDICDFKSFVFAVFVVFAVFEAFFTERLFKNQSCSCNIFNTCNFFNVWRRRSSIAAIAAAIFLTITAAEFRI